MGRLPARRGSSAGDPHVGDNVAISHHAEQSPSSETANASFRSERLFPASLIVSHCICDGENPPRAFCNQHIGLGAGCSLSFHPSNLLALHCTFSSLFSPRVSGEASQQVWLAPRTSRGRKGKIQGVTSFPRQALATSSPISSNLSRRTWKSNGDESGGIWERRGEV